MEVEVEMEVAVYELLFITIILDLIIIINHVPPSVYVERLCCVPSIQFSGEVFAFHLSLPLSCPPLPFPSRPPRKAPGKVLRSKKREVRSNECQGSCAGKRRLLGAVDSPDRLSAFRNKLPEDEAEITNRRARSQNGKTLAVLLERGAGAGGGDETVY